MPSTTVAIERAPATPERAPTTPLAELLVRLRRGAGLSQAELARKSGLSVRAIRDLEVGVTAKPRQWSLRAVADALGLTADERALLTSAAAPGLPRPDAPPALVAAGDMIGRSAELRSLLELVRAGIHRLVSVTGPGGVGKSRLATETAGVLARHAGLEVYTVDLSGVAEADRVGDVLAEALGVGGRSRLDPVSRIAAQFRSRRFVLVLDGFERLLPAAAMVRALVARCTGLSVVVTSRVPLRTGDERELRLEPLAVPPVSADPDELHTVPAMRLLVGRAAASRPGFALTAANAADLAAICRAVEGLPLAIELAAAWLRLLAPAELAARFDRRLEMLTDGPRGLPERHRSLRATIEYSLDIVGAEAQRLFAWLAPFPGGVLLADLELVTAELGRDREWLLGALGDLVDGSLVRPRAEGERTRYILLDTMRELATERLASSVDDHAVGRVVAAHYLGRLAKAAERTDGDGFAPLDSDVDNVRSALTWATGHAPDLLDVAVINATSRYCETRGRFDEGRASLLAVAQALSGSSAMVASRAYFWSGYLTRFLHDFQEAERRVRMGIALLPPDDHVGNTSANLLLGNLANDQGDLSRGMAHTSHALAAARRSGDRVAIGKALNNMAAASAGIGDLARAETLLLEALADKRASATHPVDVGRSLMNLAEVVQSAGRWEAVRSYAAEAASVLRASGHPRLYANALSLLALGHLYGTPPDLAAAGTVMDRAVGLLPDFGGDRTLRGLVQIRQSVILAARGAEGADRALGAGASVLLSSEAMTELALVAEYHAVLRAERHPEPAAVLLGLAEAIRSVTRSPHEPAGQDAAARATRICRELLGPKRFADHRERGVRTQQADIPSTMAGALRVA